MKWTCQSVKRYGKILRTNYHLFGNRSNINWKPVVNSYTPSLKCICTIQLEYTGSLVLLKTLNYWSVRSLLMFSYNFQDFKFNILYLKQSNYITPSLFFSAFSHFLTDNISHQTWLLRKSTSWNWQISTRRYFLYSL